MLRILWTNSVQNYTKSAKKNLNMGLIPPTSRLNNVKKKDDLVLWVVPKVKPWRKIAGRDIVGVGEHWPCQRRDCKEFLLSTPAGSAPSALQLRPHILSLKFLSEYFLAHIPFALHKTTKQHRWHFWGWSDQIRLIQWAGSQWNKDSSQNHGRCLQFCPASCSTNKCENYWDHSKDTHLIN